MVIGMLAVTHIIQTGDVYVGSTSGIDQDEGSKKLATEEYVNFSIENKYDENNPPPYPVVSVQGQTGEVTFNSETWTFTLADGTVVTKQVLIG